MTSKDALSLLARSGDLEALERLWAAAVGGSSLLVVVEGAAGVGKSVLVDGFVARHAEVPVWLAHAGVWEAHRPFALVEQLLRETVTATDPLDVARLILQRIEQEAPEHALPIVIDDAQHADADSLRALVSAVRRTRLSLFVVLVVGEEQLPGMAGMLERHPDHRIVVEPFSPSELQELARRVTGAPLSLRTAERLSTFTGGNTRHAAAILEESPRSLWLEGHPELPVPRLMAAGVRDRLANCTPGARALVEAASVLGESAPLEEAARLAGVDDAVSALDEAFRGGLAHTDPAAGLSKLVLQTPLVRAAVLASLGPIRLRDLNALAATIVDDEGRRLVHRFRASSTADPALAEDLDRFAESQAAEGAWSAVAHALIMASRMSPDLQSRETRFIRAVDALTGAGDVIRAHTFAPQLESFSATPLRDAALGYLAMLRGRQGEAAALLQRALDACDESRDPATAALICQRLVLDSLARWHGPDLVTWARRAMALVDPGEPSAVESEAIVGLGLAATGQTREARLSYGDAASALVRGAQPQRFRMGKGWLDLALDDPETARRELESAVPTVFSNGSARISLWAQAWLARTNFALGNWDEALANVDRAAPVIEETGLEMLRPLVHWTGAQAHALRGDDQAARSHLRRAAADSRDYPIMFLPSSIAHAQVAEAAGDYESVLRALRPVAELHPRDGIDEPGFWPWADIYANALVMTGSVDRADGFLVAHERLAQDRGHVSSRARFAYVRGRILAARGEVSLARDSFEGALALLATLSLPYDRARVNFSYGQSLRRAGKRREAGIILLAAKEGYAALGAATYVARCDRELNAAGVSAKRTVVDLAQLTAQERAVAALIAAGATNKEAASELFLSVKTVQYHLTRIYSKLKIRSRTELVAQFHANEEALA